MAWFRRKRGGPLTPEEMLAEGRRIPASGLESSRDFRLAVDDVFADTDRGIVVIADRRRRPVGRGGHRAGGA
ncbi:hypothetical protein ACFQ3B_08195 [Stackebrandtia endophytica]|uniref:hypothetical protein n=1 Tax=Stackebrandtia endophytica TaxID=1496996 RepID=UPI0011547959|nr:hypothetical protein [Stackebrandtia endophytica]